MAKPFHHAGWRCCDAHRPGIRCRLHQPRARYGGAGIVGEGRGVDRPIPSGFFRFDGSAHSAAASVSAGGRDSGHRCHLLGSTTPWTDPICTVARRASRLVAGQESGHDPTRHGTLCHRSATSVAGRPPRFVLAGARLRLLVCRGRDQRLGVARRDSALGSLPHQPNLRLLAALPTGTGRM